ncbi:uncharacterized protein SOCE26_090640 [Sorangium cellulosum]|uniref:histidine kinase n=1 Tax=Sorangium cellulosum TaxID=56 RepID=A0A2L0F7M9_SORCE|nr:PAS domain-containing protein [Sorangium cellulosum]AUX47543.1 uncharacterized protein SOCE26_090640 [Sorangium cellulosum]
MTLAPRSPAATALHADGGLSQSQIADPGGELLADLVGAPWEIHAFLRVAIGLTTALVRLHAQGLAHGDIRPANVLTDLATGQCWLTGSGRAARLPSGDPGPSGATQDDLASERPVDPRSDLHGCGATLYEMLTGRPPSADASRALPGERIGGQGARPPPPSQWAPSVPRALERIVMRLLADPAADAYPTAGGLLADLRRCASTGRIDPHVLGASDDGGAPDLLTDLDRAGASVRRSISELHGVIDAVPGLVWSARVDGSIEFLSRRWGGYSGKAEAELLGWRWTTTDLIHPDDRASVIETWTELLATGKEGHLEARLRRADGAYRWFQIQVVPLLDDRGEVVKWWGLDSDIEDQKQAQERIAGEQRLLEMITRGEPTSAILEGVVRLVEGAANGLRASILLLDENGLTLRHAAAVSLPQSYTDAIDGAAIGPDAFSCGTAVWRRELVVIADIETDPLGARFRAIALAHGLRACWSLPMLSSDGRVLGAFGIYATEPRTPAKPDLELLERCTHVTSIAVERSQSEEALRRSEACRAEAERLSRTGSFGFDIRSRDFTMSDGICEIVGLPRTPRPTLDQVARRIHVEDRERVADLVRKALRDGTTFDDEHRLVMEDGSVKLVRVLGRSRVTASGDFEVVGAATDVTASRRAADELQQAQAALAHVARVTTLGELAASIAHEVNQPLAGIVADANAALNWLAADPPDLGRVHESLTAILGDGERAGQVLQRIRSLLSRSAPRPRPCSLNDVVRDVVPLVAPELARHGVAVEQVLLHDLPQVMGDPVQLQQVVLNLLLNAGEASKDVPPERRRVVISSFVERRSSGTFAHVAIEDAGVGIDSGTNRARLFDPFYTTKENGLGMGLSISRSIIERHGGKLWASANETLGATFQFVIEVLT